MIQFNVSHDIALDEFFDVHVLQHFETSTAGSDVSSMMGKEFTLQYEVGEAKYGLRIKDGNKFESVKGGIEGPMLRLHMEELNWRDYISGRADLGLDNFIDPTSLLDPKRFDKLSGMEGTLFLKLNRDGETVVATITFNNEPAPSATLKLKLDDWLALQQGQTSATKLLMTGKISAGGDLGLITKCQSLIKR